MRNYSPLPGVGGGGADLGPLTARVDAIEPQLAVGRGYVFGSQFIPDTSASFADLGIADGDIMAITDPRNGAAVEFKFVAVEGVYVDETHLQILLTSPVISLAQGILKFYVGMSLTFEPGGFLLESREGKDIVIGEVSDNVKAAFGIDSGTTHPTPDVVPNVVSDLLIRAQLMEDGYVALDTRVTAIDEHAVAAKPATIVSRLGQVVTDITIVPDLGLSSGNEMSIIVSPAVGDPVTLLYHLINDGDDPAYDGEGIPINVTGDPLISTIADAMAAASGGLLTSTIDPVTFQWKFAATDPASTLQAVAGAGYWCGENGVFLAATVEPVAASTAHISDRVTTLEGSVGDRMISLPAILQHYVLAVGSVADPVIDSDSAGNLSLNYVNIPLTDGMTTGDICAAIGGAGFNVWPGEDNKITISYSGPGLIVGGDAATVAAIGFIIQTYDQNQTSMLMHAEYASLTAVLGEIRAYIAAHP